MSPLLDFLRDQVWAFVSAMAGVVAVCATIIIHRLTRGRKALSYEVLSVTPILRAREEVEGKLQILYNDSPVRDVYLVLVRLVNTGNTPILPQDYWEPVHVQLADSTQALTAEVTDRRPENLSATVLAEGSRVVLEPCPLNPKDALSLKVLVSEFKRDFKVSGRIAGVSRIREIGAGIPIMSLTAMCVSFLAFLATIWVQTVRDRYLLLDFAVASLGFAIGSLRPTLVMRWARKRFKPG